MTKNLNNPLTNKNQLIDHILSGCKPADNNKIGIEFENCLFSSNDYTPTTYEEIKNILNSFNKNIWQPILEKENIIGLNGPLGTVSLEPAGQLEFSSNPLKNLNEIAKDVTSYFNEVLPILAKQNVSLVSIGYNPKFNINELPLMPKERYAIMYNYMPKVGSLGRNMMKGSCTLQANFDFNSEEDLAKKFRVLMAIQPLIGVLYSNSAILEGKATNYKSFRNFIWQDTDNARAGLLDFVLEDNFTVEKYVDYALLTPMYFIYRDGNYINTSGITFKDFMIGKYKFKNITPTVKDFETHLSTIFPDVRLKTYLETRSADCPDTNYYLSLPALLTGIIYNKASLDEAFNLIKLWKHEDLQEFKLSSVKEGLSTTLYGESALNIAKKLLIIAKEGLTARKLGEEIYLNALQSLVNNNKTMAEEKILLLNKHNDINSLLKELSVKSYTA